MVASGLGILPTVGGTTRVGLEAPRPAPTAPQPASASAPAAQVASAPPAPPAGPRPPNTVAIKAFVREHVEFYFTHAYRPGTGAVIMLSNMILLREPQPIANWPGRHRVQGRMGLRYYESGMGSFATRTRNFTAEVRQLPSGESELGSCPQR